MEVENISTIQPKLKLSAAKRKYYSNCINQKTFYWVFTTFRRFNNPANKYQEMIMKLMLRDLPTFANKVNI